MGLGRDNLATTDMKTFGILLAFLFTALSALAQPIIRSTATTNQQPNTAVTFILDTNNGSLFFFQGQTYGAQSDGSIQISFTNTPFYGAVSNYASKGPMIDSIIIGNPPDMGVDGTHGDFPLQLVRDSFIGGHHSASYATNIDECVMLGWGTAIGTSGIGPYFYKDCFFMGSDCGPISGTNVVKTICIGPLSGVGMGTTTNVIVIGAVSGAGDSGVVYDLFGATNQLIIGNDSDLPYGHGGEMSIMNYLYATNLNNHARGNLGIGTIDLQTTLTVNGPIGIEVTTPAPVITGTDCVIWNSNKVLYGVSSTQTKLIVDLR